MRNNREVGFTLIELLVVIGIIGVLASVIMVSLNTSRQRARDSKRISEIGQIRTALESFYAENGYYPPSSCGYDCNGYSTSSTANWDTLGTFLLPYIQKLPTDPKNIGTYPWVSGEYTYSYGNVGRYIYTPQYDLTTKFEQSGNILSCGNRNYKFYFDNTASWCGAYPQELYEASSQ